ncbi:hypothetical protein SB725_12635 [Pseudomonas sp. SIMBA_041]|uniref:hypothetical protein n=1 Tax=Pseudomonas sp. SIMBA_041 TaxID=3085782 RepID=UPI00397A1640
MNERKLSFTDERYWDDKVASNTKLFHEADRLEGEAYELIKDDRSPQAWARFTAAKAKADATRAAAFDDWQRLKRLMAGEEVT